MTNYLKVFSFNDKFIIGTTSYAKMQSSPKGDAYFSSARNTYKVVKDNTTLIPNLIDSGDNVVALFDVPFDDTVQLLRIETQDIVDQYEPRDGFESLHTISSDAYKSLNKNFQQKYRPVSSGKADNKYNVTISEDTTDEDSIGIIRYDTDFDYDVYSGEKISELRRIMEGKEYQPKFSMDNFLPREVNHGEIILGILKRLYQSEGAHSNDQVRVEFKEPLGFGLLRTKNPLDVECLEVTYFATPYRGETKKRLSYKQNGQPYADRRGRIVPDYPEVASTVTIFDEDFSHVSFSDSDTENLQTLWSIYNAIFHP